MASSAQINFINVLLAEREVDADIREVIQANLDTMTIASATDWISWLKKQSRAQDTLDIEVAERQRPTEPGFYLVDGEVFKVVHTRDGERMYAKKTGPNGLEYVPGAMRKIFADQKMTGEQIAAHGLAHGYCVVCSSGFEDPTSSHIGIGPVCGPRVMGKEAYKALRASVSHLPDVIAYEEAKKARAKEAREAKKAEEAQLSLV